MSKGTTPIPTPPGLPLVGNAFDFDSELPLRTFQNFANEYGKLTSIADLQGARGLTNPPGEIYRLNLPAGPSVVVVSTNRRPLASLPHDRH